MEEKIKPAFWHRPTFLIVTGASRGIGKNIAVEFSRLLHSNSTIVLLARTLSNLEDTKNEILKINSNLTVQVESVDLSKPDLQLYERILKTSASNRIFELYFLVHNAASIVCEIPASQMDDIRMWNEYMSLNLYSVAVLTSVFLKLFQNGERCLLNVTSLAGVSPMKGLAYYSVGKASREMYFRALSAENPSLNILNYAPGPIETDMFLKVAEECFDLEVKKSFKTMKNDNKTVKINDTVQKVINLLESRCYKNGDRIDFYD